MKYLAASLIIFGLVQINCSRDPLQSAPGKGVWTVISQTETGMDAIFFVNDKHGWIAGNDGVLKYTSDGGYHWSDQVTGTHFDLKSIYFISEKAGFVSGANRTLLRTMDGGNSWTPCTVPDEDPALYFSLQECNGKIYFISNMGKIFSSGNNVQSWELVSRIEDFGLTYLYFHDNIKAFAMQSFGNYLYKTTDGSATWTKHKLPSLFMGDVCFINDKAGWTCENFGPSSSIHDSTCIYMTNDGGEHWNHIYTFNKWITFSNICFMNKNEGWLTGVDKIYYTSTGGKNWETEYDHEGTGFVNAMHMINKH